MPTLAKYFCINFNLCNLVSSQASRDLYPSKHRSKIDGLLDFAQYRIKVSCDILMKTQFLLSLDKTNQRSEEAFTLEKVVLYNCAQTIEATLGASPGPYLVCHSLTIADLAVFNALHMGLTIIKDPSYIDEEEVFSTKENFGKLNEWYKTMKQIETIRNTHKFFTSEYRLL